MWRLLVVLALGACASEEDIVLEITGEACVDAPEAAARVAVLSVDVLGTSGGQECILAKRCIFDVEATTADELVAALAEAVPPLVDVDADAGRWLQVVGHERSCWDDDDHLVCGSADLADISDGALPLRLGCAACRPSEVPFCP